MALLETGKMVYKGTVDEVKKRFGVGYNLKVSVPMEFTIERLSQIKDTVCLTVIGSYQ